MGAPANLFFRDELRVALVEKGSRRGLVAVAARNEADLLGVPVLDAARVVGRLVDRKAVLVLSHVSFQARPRSSKVGGEHLIMRFSALSMYLHPPESELSQRKCREAQCAYTQPAPPRHATYMHTYMHTYIHMY